MPQHKKPDGRRDEGMTKTKGEGAIKERCEKDEQGDEEGNRRIIFHDKSENLTPFDHRSPCSPLADTLTKVNTYIRLNVIT